MPRWRLACLAFHGLRLLPGRRHCHWLHATSRRRRAVGSGHPRIVFRLLLPNLAPVLIVITTLDPGNAVLFTATLSFLGLGAQPPTPE